MREVINISLPLFMAKTVNGNFLRQRQGFEVFKGLKMICFYGNHLQLKIRQGV
ncbi:MAG: hypothetical protein UV20_C0045G0004 [Candidatus Magasanikbacteria bacterium GW2011_GWA2_42_32]|uniref:Uncharacterized protein n=1 Tax=Candidatus Magasanikbacteria bacterium GW2011_GWA2_42_32 TaxID=1619039 RepID=A0A0G1CW23_9BACT|nr:MAG: hypothetical protein UV20_C0045G0004 [Candidatus Magasanikbacteria bacterium GW2011_GWA2_42_32]